MRRILLVTTVSIIFAAIHAVLYMTPFGREFEAGMLSFWFAVRGTVEPPSEVVLVAMDEESYRTLELPMNQPWPRAVHATLLERLAAVGARRVVFDVLFLGAGSDEEVDATLARSFGALPTVLGAELGSREVGGFRSEELLLPYRPFLEHAERAAIVNLPEENGYIRRFFPVSTELASNMLTLAQAGAVGEGSASANPSERDLINYYGPAGTIPTFSYYQIIDPEVPLPETFLRDKVVYVGLLMRSGTGPSQKDSFLTPYQSTGRTFGVEIHATAAANIMKGDFIRRASLRTELIALSTLVIAGSALCMVLSPIWGALVIGAAIVAWSSCAYYLFLRSLYAPGALALLITLPVVYLCSTVVNYLRVRRSQRAIKQAFQLYISPEMANEVARNPHALRLGGEKVVATALFTDIVNFTSISEEMEAEEVTTMLNDYFSEVMETIFHNRGTLIKFIGDAVFAVWGAPIKIENHAELAAKTALEIRARVEKFNALKKYPALNTRLGLHSGPMVIGNLGSHRRFDFTAIGDAVNVASRLEGLNKRFGTTIIISEDLRRGLEGKGDYNLVPLGAIRAAGKSDAIELYGLSDAKLTEAHRAEWNAVLTAVRGARFDAAREALITISHAQGPLAVAAALYLTKLPDLVERFEAGSSDFYVIEIEEK